MSYNFAYGSYEAGEIVYVTRRQAFQALKNNHVICIAITLPAGGPCHCVLRPSDKPLSHFIQGHRALRNKYNQEGKQS